MSRKVGRTLAVVLLFVLGVAIGGPALDLEFEPSAPHYDGDADDAGHVGKVFVPWVDTAVSYTLTFVPSSSRPHRAPTALPKPKLVALAPLSSRAPPA
jgi:hypothetical protein